VMLLKNQTIEYIPAARGGGEYVLITDETWRIRNRDPTDGRREIRGLLNGKPGGSGRPREHNGIAGPSYVQ